MKLSAPSQGLIASGITAASFPLVDTSTVAFHSVVQLGSAQSFTYDAANSTGLMNGTSAQTFSIYNTYTAGTPDYERMEFFWTGNTAVIRAAANGTGTSRNLEVRVSGGTAVGIRLATTVGAGVQLLPSGSSTLTTAVFVGVATGGSTGATSGTTRGVELTYTTTDSGTNSTTIHNALNVAPTINYTGASRTGKVVLAYFNPVNTSLPTGLNAAISFSTTASGLTSAIIYHNVADETTNYEYVGAKWASNVFTYSMVAAGSGTWRDIAFQINNPAATSVVKMTSTSTIAGAVTDGYCSALRLSPTYNAGTALTVTRHNYIDLNTPVLGGAGPAAVTDAAVFRFDAAPGTHKALAADAAVAVTFTALGPTGASTTIQGWMKINVNGTMRYVPFW